MKKEQLQVVAINDYFKYLKLCELKLPVGVILQRFDNRFHPWKGSHIIEANQRGLDVLDSYGIHYSVYR